jgi:hypothetical protein
MGNEPPHQDLGTEQIVLEDSHGRRTMDSLAAGPRRGPHHRLTMVTRLLIEDCARLEIKNLFRLGRVGAGSSGSWRGQRWRIDGSFLVMSDSRWKLVPTRQKNVDGTTWLVQSSKDGRRYRHLLMTPDGRVGTRGELVGIRYRSQRIWTKKKQRAYRRHKVIEKLDGPTDFQWVTKHETYVPEKRRRMRATTYRRLRKRLVTTPKDQPAQNQLANAMGRKTATRSA